jgi:hypothetical protein
VLMLGIGGMLGLQAATVIAPPLRALLATTPLGLADLAVIGAGATVPLVAREMLKTRRPDSLRTGASPQGDGRG